MRRRSWRRRSVMQLVEDIERVDTQKQLTQLTLYENVLIRC